MEVYIESVMVNLVIQKQNNLSKKKYQKDDDGETRNGVKKLLKNSY